MRKLRALWIRFTGLLRPRRTDDEFSQELDSHIGMHVDEALRSGLSPDEARRRALIQLGGVEQVRQAQRERTSLPWIENLVRDLRYAVRRLAKHPAVTAIAILSIGLGIGANATIFSMVNRFVLRPAPMGNPTTLLALHTTHDGDRCCNSFSWPLYTDVRDQARSFAGVAAYYELIPASIGGPGEPERVWGQGVTANFFDVTELHMVLGRGFTPSEESAPSVVLGENLWRRRFDSDPALVGKSVHISGRNFTVVGIAPPSFHGADQILYTEFWVPIGNIGTLVPTVPDQKSRQFHFVDVLARLAPGVSPTRASVELKGIARRLASAYPDTDKGSTIVFEQAGSLPSNVRGPVILFFTALTVVVLLVLAIAGANVANLLFAQAALRQRDMAIRLAMGATRARLRRQMLMESVLLGLGGGATGVLLSLWSTNILSAMRLPAPVPIDVRIDEDWRVLAFAFALSVVSGVVLGVAPAWAASHPRLANSLKGEDALARPGRPLSLRNILIVVQIAMSVVLLSLTGLFLRSLGSAATIDIGFRPQGLLKMSVDPRVHGYTAERTAQFFGQIRQRVAALPGVDAVACTDVALLSDGNRSDAFSVAANPGSGPAPVDADLYMVTPGFFDVMGIPRLSGSDFGDEKSAAINTAVVSQSFAERVLGQKNPLGQRITGGGTTYEIIGVVGNVKSRSLGEDIRPVLYRSLNQSIAADPSLMGYTLLVHTSRNPASLEQSVRREIHVLDPAMAIYGEETMEEHVRTAYFLPRLAATLFGVFGFIGLLLAAVGLYGVMSYAVSRRTREIGIRMALGARPGLVERLVVRQGMVLAIIAMVIGWPAAWMLSRLASSFLYGIQPHDSLTFTIVPLFLAGVALVACWLPARRAASIDPVQALRTE
ncbi:ABC transporter permease [Telmatobacter sp. DSM 110680]|uniref:ABC transporter permease n=1 Tax=Telmatobacter sp. DSM 110680 TaxID=3036704 RepID=A0AAU7DM84_9BACT